MKILAGLDNQEIHPDGWEEFGLKREFEVKGNRVTITAPELILVNEDRQLVHDWVYNQYGRFVNIPAKVVSDTGYESPFVLNLKGLRWSGSSVTPKLEVREGNDNFFARSNGLTFNEIQKKGFLPDSLFVDVPYQIVKNYTTLEKIVLLATLLSLAQTLINIIKAAADLASMSANPTNVGVIILQAIALAIWLIATIILIIQTIKEIKELVYPKVRYLKACSDYDLIKAGCDYMGFTFVSDYLEQYKDKLFVIPVPEAIEGKSTFDFDQNELSTIKQNKGWPTELDSVRKHWDAIDEWLQFRNMELFVKDGVVRMEPPAYFDSTANLTIPVAFSNQADSESEWTYNDDPAEVWRRKYIKYFLDYTDSHCPDMFGQLRTEMLTEAVNIPPDGQDLVNHEGYYEVVSKYSLLKRKDKLLPGEKLIYKIAQKCDDIVNAFGGGSNLASGILKREGIGMIGDQYFANTKRAFLDRATGKQPADYLDQLSTDKIYEEDHAEYEVKNANSIRFESVIPLSPANFDTILGNNRVFLEGTNQLAKIMSCTYQEAKSVRTATMILQIPDPSAFNTTTIKIN